jgi:hypothetical protein
MFSYEGVKERVRGQPFRTVRIVLSTGQSYDIAHPDLVFVGKRFLIVGVPDRDDPAVADRVTHVALSHVTELLDMAASTPQLGNGAA